MKMRKIAVEEAFSIPEVAEALKQVARAPGESSDLPLMRGIYDTQGGYGTMKFLEGLLDLEDRRAQGHGRQRRGHAAAVPDGPGRADV